MGGVLTMNRTISIPTAKTEIKRRTAHLLSHASMRERTSLSYPEPAASCVKVGSSTLGAVGN